MSAEHRIYYFSAENGETEFVVISDQGEKDVLENFASEDCQLQESLAIEGDATSMPCDRKLFK